MKRKRAEKHNVTWIKKEPQHMQKKAVAAVLWLAYD